MAKLNAPIERFNVGEYSQSGLQRIDIDRTRFSAEIQENLFPAEIGKAQVRPGTTYIATGENSVKLIPFVRSPSQKALLELSGGQLRVILNDEVLTRPETGSSFTLGIPLDLTEWSLGLDDGAAISWNANGATFGPNARGAQCWAEATTGVVIIPTAAFGVEHAISIEVTKGPILFQMGSTPASDNLISQTYLDRGWHSLSFTPVGNTAYPRFSMLDAERSATVRQVIMESGEIAVPAPWGSSDLTSFQYEQSHDVIFLANRNLPPLKIERRGDGRSWSVVYYETEDGPFRDIPPGFGEIGATVGVGLNTTLTVEEAVLAPGMEGSLVRLFHENRNNTVQLAGENQWCDTFRVSGILGENVNDRKYDYNVSGTGSGTISFQRSISGEDGDYQATNIKSGTSTSTIAMPATVGQAHNGEEEDNNLLAFHRIGYRIGDYTSGVTSVNVNYQGDSGYGRGRISNVTSISADFETISRVNAENSETKVWQIGAWSDFYEWPRSVAIWDNRIWWGGTDRVWGSARNTLFTFDDLEAGDTATIQRRLSSGGASLNAEFLLPLQRLVIGTSGAELSLRASAVGEVVSESNATIRTASNYGSAPVQPVKIDGRGVFVHRDSVTSMLLNFANQAGDYAAAKLTEYNDEILLPGCVEMAVSRQPETYVWHVREDGQVAILMLDPDAREEPLLCWTRYVTEGEVQSVAVLPGDEQDDVYLAVKRERPVGGAIELAAGMGTDTYATTDFRDGSYAYREDIGEIPTENNGWAGTTEYNGRIGPWGEILSGIDQEWSTEFTSRFVRKEDGGYYLEYHNSFSYSQDLANKPWTESRNVTWAANAALAPNGEMAADHLMSDGGSGYHIVRQGVYSSMNFNWNKYDFWASKKYSWSIWAKGAGHNQLDFVYTGRDSFAVPDWMDTSNPDVSELRYTLNLTTGNITKAFHHALSQPSYDTVYEWRDPQVIPYPDDWYRIIMSPCTTLSRGASWSIRLRNNGGAVQFSEAGGGVYLWGAMLHYIGTRDDRYVANIGNSSTLLMPVEYDIDGTCRGVRVEPQVGMPSENTRSYSWRGIGPVLDLDDEVTSRPVGNGYGPNVVLRSGGDPRNGKDYVGAVSMGVNYPNDYLPAPDGTYTAFDMTLNGQFGETNMVLEDFSGMTLLNIDQHIQVMSTFVHPENSTGRYLQMCYVQDRSRPDWTFYSDGFAPAFSSWTFDIKDPSGPVLTQRMTFASNTSNINWDLSPPFGIEQYANGWWRIWVNQYVLGSFGRFDSLIIDGQVAEPAEDSIAYVGYGSYGANYLTPLNTMFTLWASHQHEATTPYYAAPHSVIDVSGFASQGSGNHTISNHEILPDELFPTRWGNNNAKIFFQQTIKPIGAVGSTWFTTEDDDIYHFNFLEADDGLNSANHTLRVGLRGGYNSGGGALNDLYAFDNDREEPEPDWTYMFTSTTDVDGTVFPLLQDRADSGIQWATQKFLDPKGGWDAPTRTVAWQFDQPANDSKLWVDGAMTAAGSAVDIDWTNTVGNMRFELGGRQMYYIESFAWSMDTGANALESPFVALDLSGISFEIEKLNKLSEARGGVINKMGDAGSFFEGPVSSVLVTQLANVSNLTVWGTRVSDGVTGPILGLSASGSGLVNLGDTYTNVFVGRPYSARFKSAKLAYAGEGGTAMAQDKRVSQVGLLLTDAHKDAVKYGHSFDRMRSMPAISRGKPIPDNTVHEHYDDVTFAFPGQWDTDSRVHLKVDAPYPATLTGLVVGVETNTRGGKNPRR